jgi:hypothetical protein
MRSTGRPLTLRGTRARLLIRPYAIAWTVRRSLPVGKHEEAATRCIAQGLERVGSGDQVGATGAIVVLDQSCLIGQEGAVSGRGECIPNVPRAGTSIGFPFLAEEFAMHRRWQEHFTTQVLDGVYLEERTRYDDGT